MEMMVEMKSPHGLTQTILHIVDTTSKSYIPSLLDAMWDVILQKLMEAAVGILCQTDPSHAELYKTFLTDPNIVIPENVSKLLKCSFAGAQDDPTLMQLWSRLISIKLFTILRLEYDRYTLRPQLDAIKIKNPLFIINLPRSCSTFTFTQLASHPKANS